VYIYAGSSSEEGAMKRILALLVLSLLLIGCERFIPERVIAREKATWRGKSGVALTITQTFGTNYLDGATDVSFIPAPVRWQGYGFWAVSDLTFPIMRVEARRVTIFFYDDHPCSSLFLSTLPDALLAGTVAIHPCSPTGIC
jgi:hypothetical protein